MNVQSFSRNIRGQCAILRHKGSTGITWLGLEVKVRKQWRCD